MRVCTQLGELFACLKYEMVFQNPQLIKKSPLGRKKWRRKRAAYSLKISLDDDACGHLVLNDKLLQNFHLLSA